MFFLVKLEEGRVWRRHFNQIKKRIENKSSNSTITNDGNIPNLTDFPIESVPYPTIADTREPSHMEDSTLNQNETVTNHTSSNQRRSNRNRRPLNLTFKEGGNVATVWTIVSIINTMQYSVILV